ncbi:polysaccharide biosynthesis/export family protein, partial [uncultured Sphingorhabdus sp.]|uniref:polysaccharide biosynthesis/export family protein n=1 Tax=uncultured Sphingorhabdus sp. TaxID=1686106 RepID=UPI00261CC873
MHRVIIYIAAICLVALSGLSTVGQTTGNAIVSTVANATDERYRIGFQDTIEIQVFRHPELNIRQTVSPTGTIRLYRHDKPIVAACKTERELAQAIEAAYQVSYLKNPQVSVMVTEQKSQPISVIGAVEKAGSYYVSRKMHLLEILAMAGGPNKEAGTRMLVARAGTSSNCQLDNQASSDNMELFNFKIRDVQEGKKSLKMEPGDIVSVLSSDFVYVYGNVTEPGQL